MSYLSNDEIAAAQKLHRRGPYSILNVSKGYFSIARYYGGMSMDGSSYTYLPAHDELIRDDVLEMVIKMRKETKAKAGSSHELPGM